MAYAFHFVANNLLEFFRHSYSSILDGDFALLPEVPASWGAEAGTRAETVLPLGHSPSPARPGLFLPPRPQKIFNIPAHG